MDAVWRVVVWLSVVRLGVIPCALARRGVLVGESQGARVSSVPAVNGNNPGPHLRATADFGVGGSAKTGPAEWGMTNFRSGSARANTGARTTARVCP